MVVDLIPSRSSPYRFETHSGPSLIALFDHSSAKWCPGWDSNPHGLSATDPSSQRVYHSTTWAFVFGGRIVNVTLRERPLERILQSFEFVLQVANPYPEP